MTLELSALPLALLAGVLSVLSPCVWPLVPIVMGSAAGAGRSGPLALAAGLSVSFALAGTLLSFALISLGLDPELFRYAAATLLVVGRSDRLVTGGQYHMRSWEVDMARRRIFPSDWKTGSIKRIFTAVVIDETDTRAFVGTTSGDVLQFTYQQTREPFAQSYRLAYGDQVRVSSDTHPELNVAEPIEIMPDGTISIPGLQSVAVADLTLAEARLLLEEKLVTIAKYHSPRITLLPVRVYQRLNDLLAAVSSQFQNGGQNLQLTVIRDGTLALPLIGTICVIGLTREELMAEINARYSMGWATGMDRARPDLATGSA